MILYAEASCAFIPALRFESEALMFLDSKLMKDSLASFNQIHLASFAQSKLTDRLL